VTKYLVGGKQVGTSFFVHHRDHLGSIQAVTDSAGAEVRRQKHKPFADQHYASGSHLESKGWIGEREEETELLYLNARYFDPEIGSFASPDPIARPGQGLNRYSYAWNNPGNFFDPTGLDPPTDPCAGMNYDECFAFLENYTKNTAAGYCEANPYCSGAMSDLRSYGYGMDPPFKMLQKWDRINGEGETEDGTQSGDISTPGSETGTTTGTSVVDPTQPPLKYCEKHPDRCSASAASAEAVDGSITRPSEIFDKGFDPDFMVFGGSWSAFPWVVGGGSGFEGVSFAGDRPDIVGYSHSDYGVGFPGASALFAIGWGWNAHKPNDYLGVFNSISGGLSVISIGGTFFWSKEGTFGFTVGIYLGSPSVSFVREHYQYLHPSRVPPDNDS
jgi:RHS repeat-associated protein